MSYGSYSCFVTPESHGDFVAWSFGMPLPEERFFLIARPALELDSEN